MAVYEHYHAHKRDEREKGRDRKKEKKIKKKKKKKEMGPGESLGWMWRLIPKRIIHDTTTIERARGKGFGSLSLSSQLSSGD